MLLGYSSLIVYFLYKEMSIIFGLKIIKIFCYGFLEIGILIVECKVC